MKIYSWNVNGIRAVHQRGDLARFLAEHNPAILCLQETKAFQDQVTLDLADYQEYWTSAVKKGYSGTAIFTKQEPLEVWHGLPEDIVASFPLADQYGNTALEGRVTAAEFNEVIVVSVYTPNAKDDLSRVPLRETAWDPAFLAYMKRLQTIKPLIISGDFNVAHTELDLARPRENVGKKGYTDEERAGFTNLTNAGFVDSFRLFHAEGGHYTWWSHFAQARLRNIGWRIDYVLADERLVPKIQNAAIHPDVYGSDHCPVSITIQAE